MAASKIKDLPTWPKESIYRRKADDLSWVKLNDQIHMRVQTAIRPVQLDPRAGPFRWHEEFYWKGYGEPEQFDPEEEVQIVEINEHRR